MFFLQAFLFCAVSLHIHLISGAEKGHLCIYQFFEEGDPLRRVGQTERIRLCFEKRLLCGSFIL